MVNLFPTGGGVTNPWLAPKQIPTIQDYFKGGNIFAAKPIATDNPGTTQQTYTVTGPAATGTGGGQQQQVTTPTATAGLAGTDQRQVAVGQPAAATAAPANPFYTPQTPDGKWIAGAGVADHTDPNAAYTWGISAGDPNAGANMLTSYNGTQDHARWSYAQNSNENSWDHWDRLRHDLMKKYGMNIQQASDEALRQMYASYQAAGKDWSQTGFGVVPGVKAAGSGTNGNSGSGTNGSGNTGTGAGSGTDANGNPIAPSASMGPYSTTQADVLLTGENGQDPYAALREAMRRSGVNLDAPGLMSSYIKRRFKDVTQALMGTAGLGNGGDKYGEVNNLIQMLGQGLTTPGVNLGPLLQQRSRNILGSADFANSMGTVDQNQAIDYLKTLGALDTFGAPDLIQAAQAAGFGRAENQFRDQSFGLTGTPDQQKNIPDFLTWFRQNMAGSGIFGF